MNFCAPTCCNKTFDIDILDADGRTVLSQMKNVYPGINCRCVADVSHDSPPPSLLPAAALPAPPSTRMGWEGGRARKQHALMCCQAYCSTAYSIDNITDMRD